MFKQGDVVNVKGEKSKYLVEGYHSSTYIYLVNSKGIKSAIHVNRVSKPKVRNVTGVYQGTVLVHGNNTLCVQGGDRYPIIGPLAYVQSHINELRAAHKGREYTIWELTITSKGTIARRTGY